MRDEGTATTTDRNEDGLVWSPGASPGARDLIGEKAVGLMKLPVEWTPPFFVLTTRAHAAWRSGHLRPGWIELACNRDVVGRTTFDDVTTGAVIVRSSGVAEHLEERGRLTSEVVPAPDYDQLEAAANRCWEAAENLAPEGGDRDQHSVALIVQRYQRPRRHGHVSNERRVSERHDSWLVESWTAELEWLGPSRISPNYETRPPARLVCPSSKEIERCLRVVASFQFARPSRRHFEWVWDGANLWVVQCDFERVPAGSPPNSAWTPRAPTPMGEPRVFVDARSAVGDWQKTECVRVFEACGLPTSDLWVLEHPGPLSALSAGDVPGDVAMDLDRLLEAPVVVRTDIARSRPDRSAILLPRTETCTSQAQVIEFFRNTASRLMNDGINASEFCFLVHRFLPARSGTYSVATPDRKRVRIDSIWGVPDGLLYLAHDSLEVTTSGEVTMERLRCKQRYVDFGADGLWFEKEAGTPWDWRRSVEREEAALIAQQAYAIAQHQASPVEVMHFVGVDSSTRLPAVLPWFFRTTDLHMGEHETAPWFSAASYLVRTIADVEELRANLPVSIRSLRVRADTAYVHDQEFVKQVASAALELGLPVDLEGSVLAHAYYMLRREGVRVRAVDYHEPPPIAGVQRFDKLVRDNIPAIIERAGEHALTRRASKTELLALLRQKVVEEALELHQSEDDAALVEEAADLFEVLRSIAYTLDIRVDDIVAEADRKREQRGGFADGIVLRGTYVRPLSARRSGEQLFEVEEDPFVTKRSLMRSLALLADDADLRILVNPGTAAMPPDRLVAGIPGAGVAVEITTDESGIRLAVIPTASEPNPDQGRLFDA